MEHYNSAMRRLIKFKPEIQHQVDETFQKIAQKMDLDVKEVVFIGIHNNRYKVQKAQEKSKKVGKKSNPAGSVKPLKRSYFQDAMEAMV